MMCFLVFSRNKRERKRRNAARRGRAVRRSADRERRRGRVEREEFGGHSGRWLGDRLTESELSGVVPWDRRTGQTNGK